MVQNTWGLSKEELAVLRPLSTPIKIQNYLDSLAINHEKRGETCMSPRRVIREQKAHCIEAAMLAAIALSVHGEKPLLMDLKTTSVDDDHVVALYKVNGLWGAISKTNHVTLRFRDPIYKTVRELAASYFHEYFLNANGKKTLRSHSGPINLSQFGIAWVISKDELWDIADALDMVEHFSLFPSENKRYIRNADPIELKAGKLIEWRVKDKGT